MNETSSIFMHQHCLSVGIFHQVIFLEKLHQEIINFEKLICDGSMVHCVYSQFLFMNYSKWFVNDRKHFEPETKWEVGLINSQTADILVVIT